MADRNIAEGNGVQPNRKFSGLTVLLMVGVGLAGCAKTEYLGNAAQGFWSDTPAKVPPNEAFRLAQPYLDVTWERRCQELRHQDEYCNKPPVDHMVRRGKFYYLTRTSYPYKNYDAYLQYAVKVNAQTGEVIALK